MSRLAALLLMLCAATPAWAATYMWNNANGGNWNTAANWTPNVVPTAADTAEIILAGTYTVTLNVSTNVKSLILGGAASGVQTLAGTGFNLVASNSSIMNGGVLALTNATFSGTNVVQSGGLLEVSGVTLDAQVTVASGGELLAVGSVSDIGQNSGANNTNYWLTVQRGGVVNAGAQLICWALVTNSGVINLTNGANYIYNNGTVNWNGGLYNLSGGVIDLWNNAGLFDEGGDGILVNQGTINLSSGTASSSVLITRFTNSGTVSTSVGTGTLEIGYFSGAGSLTGTFNAASGTIIELAATSNPGTSAGAGLTVEGAGQVRFFAGLLNLATATIPNLIYTGGTVSLGSGFQGGAISSLALDGSSLSNNLLAVTGTLAMTNGTLYGTNVVENGAVLTVNGVTLAAQVTVDNGGELLAVGSASDIGQNSSANNTNYWLTVQSGGVVNAGAELTFWALVTNSGVINLTNFDNYIYNNGTVNFNGGLYNLAGGVIDLWNNAGLIDEESDGILVNQGTINLSSGTSTSLIDVNNLTNSGTLNALHGTLVLEGTHVMLQSTGTLSVGLNSATDFGSITYDSSTALNLSQVGTELVTLNGGYVPAANAQFKVLSATGAGTFSGAFANFSSPSGAIWATNYATTSFTLTYEGRIIWAAPANITYGAALGSGQLDAASAPNIGGSFTYNPPALTVLNSGPGQLLTATFTPSAANEAPATLQVPITVLKANLGITAKPESKTYGQTFTFAGTEFNTSGLVNGDTVTSASLASLGSPSTALVSGSPYTITINNAVGDAGLTNYIIAYNTSLLTVNPLAVILTGTRSYDGTTAAASTILSVANPVNSDVVNLASGSAVLAGANVGAEAITSGGTLVLGGAAANNYTLTGASGSVTITTAGLTITASPQSKTYGQTVAFGSGSMLFMPSGLQHGETVGSVTLTVNNNGGAATAPVSGSPYPITPSAATGGTFSPGNYMISYNTGLLTINPLPVILTGTNDYNATTNVAASVLVVSNALAGDNVTVASGAGGMASPYIGTNAMTSSGTLALGGPSAGNYTTNGMSGALVVIPLPVIVSGTRPYDATATALASILAINNNFDGTNLTLAGSATLASASVGMEAISGFTGLSLGGAQATNYTLTGASGSVAITIAAPVVTCPANIQDNIEPGECGQTESLAATVNDTGGPTTLTYTIPGPMVITSPYFFPVGTTEVTCTAVNATGMDSCSFTVTVINNQLPVAGSFAISPTENTSESIPIAKILAVAQDPSPTFATGGWLDT